MVAKVEPEIRTCIACPNTFLVGGTGNKKRNTKTCSQQCNGKVRATRPGKDCEPLTDVDAAYLAGMIDADGSIGLYQRGSGQSARVHIGLTNSDKPLLLWVQGVTDLGSVNRQRAATDKWREVLQWNCSGPSSISLLTQLLPYLRVKRDRAELAIDFYNKRQAVGNRIDLSWQEVYREKMLALNRRGPKEQEWPRY